jgi:hypothetical protein
MSIDEKFHKYIAKIGGSDHFSPYLTNLQGVLTYDVLYNNFG